MRGDKEREAAATAPFLCLSTPLSENNLGIKSKMNQLFSISVTEPALTFVPQRRPAAAGAIAASVSIREGQKVI